MRPEHAEQIARPIPHGTRPRAGPRRPRARSPKAAAPRPCGTAWLRMASSRCSPARATSRSSSRPTASNGLGRPRQSTSSVRAAPVHINAKPTWHRAAGLCGIAFALATLAAGAAAQEAQDPAPRVVEPARAVKTELELGRGRATWYGVSFHGRRTSNGERFNMGALTAAHENLPFGARVRVRNLANGREVVVRINDRAP